MKVKINGVIYETEAIGKIEYMEYDKLKTANNCIKIIDHKNGEVPDFILQDITDMINFGNSQKGKIVDNWYSTPFTFDKSIEYIWEIEDKDLKIYSDLIMQGVENWKECEFKKARQIALKLEKKYSSALVRAFFNRVNNEAKQQMYKNYYKLIKKG